MNSNGLKRLRIPMAVAALCAAAGAYADTPQTDISLHGFVDATFFWQNQNFTFGNGQDAEFAVPSTANNDLTGGDMRNTRLWLNIGGAQLPDSSYNAGAYIEGDFFGGFNGTGAFSSQQPVPRLRQAYISLDDPTGGDAWKIGQQWSLLFPLDNSPESYAHIAFPLGYSTGVIGWRFPGVVWSHTLSNSSDSQWRLDVGAFEGAWSGPGSDINFDTAGNVDFHPQVEARLHVQDGDLLWYAVAHYSSESLTGVGGTAPAPITDSITSDAFEAGVGWHPGSWILHAGAYAGKGLGENFGAMAQFGDISEWGGYAQFGYQFTPQWKLLAFYATVRPNQGDVVTWVAPGGGTTAYLRNQQVAGDLLYADGPWGFGFEWLHAITRYTTVAGGGSSAATVGDQVSASAIYHF